MILGRLVSTVYVMCAAALITGSANAASLAVDQIGSSFNNGGYGTPVVQTFTPSENNIAGVDVLISGTSAFTANVSVSLFADAALTDLLAEDAIADHPRNTTATFRWMPVAVVPETLYYFEFVTDALGIAAGISNTTDPYDRGNIIQGGGNLFFNFEDAVFSTYYDTEFSVVPIPPAIWLFLSAFALIGQRRKFRP